MSYTSLSRAMIAAAMLTLCAPCAGLAAMSEEDLQAELLRRNLTNDNESFMKEVQAGHTDNVKFFLTIGANPGMINKEGVPALSAALTAPTMDVFNLLMEHVPADAAAAAPFLNIQDNDGNTVLLKAVDKQNEAAVDALLARGADVGITNKTRTNALMIAVQKKNAGMVKKLIAADETSPVPLATINAEDSRGNRSVIYAILAETPDIMKMLIDARGDVVTADTQNVTPLMVAAEQGNEVIVNQLLAAGAKLDATSKSGANAVSMAIRKGHGLLARKLMEKGGVGPGFNYLAAVNATLDVDPIDAEFFAYLLNHLGQTDALPPSLLFKALDRKSEAAAKLLLERNIDVKAVNENNETLFYHAIDAGFEDIALDLIKLGANVTQGGSSSAGLTPLTRAVRHNMPKVVEILLTKGANADQKTPEGYTLAEMCVYSGYPETLEVLLKHNVKLEKEFALLWAIRDGKGKTVPVLLDHGAVADIMNPDGAPAILLAAEAGQADAVKAFIAHHAALDYPNKTQNRTALIAAAHAGNLEIVKMLVEGGAKLEASDNFGMTPLAHAAVLSRVDVVEYLLSKGASPKAVDGQKRTVNDIASQAPASPERDRVMQALAKASAQ